MDCRRAETADPEEWLESRPDFSRPLCETLREWILSWQPDLTESIKWNNLCFSGRKLVCGISGCQKHVSIIFFRGTELPDRHRLFAGGENNTAIRSVRLTSLDRFPREHLRDLLRCAMELDSDPEAPPVPKLRREPWPMPDFFQEALRKNGKASRFFESLAPTYQREYLVWVSTAKRPETREQRLKQTLHALAAGRKWIDRKLA